MYFGILVVLKAKEVHAHLWCLLRDAPLCLISLAADLKFLSCPNICHYRDREERERENRTDRAERG